MSELEQSVNSFANGDYVARIIVAVVLLIITSILSRYSVRIIRKLLSSDGAPLPSSSIIEIIVRIVVWAVGGSVILSMCFGIDVGALLAAIGVGGVALSLGLQDTISNFIAGLQTIVKDFENNVHTIPNSSINSGEVEKIEPTNLIATMISFTNDTRDIDETVRKMELLAKEALEEVAELEKDPWILLTQIGEYGTWAKMRFVLKDMTNVREARDTALRAISPYTRLNPDEMPNGKVNGPL